MKKLCVFDFDGTLVDTIADIGESVNWCLEKMGKPIHELSAYNKMVGNGMNLLCRRALGDGTEEEVQALINMYKKRYQECCCVKTRMYDGIKELLDDLKEAGIILAIVTNKPQIQTDEIISKLFDKSIFFEIIGQSERFPTKPDPESLNYVIEKAGVSKEDVWYIGDSDVDIILGRNAGVDAIGVEWGLRGKKELVETGARYIAKDAEELKSIIMS